MTQRQRYQSGMAAYNAGRYTDAIEQLTGLLSDGHCSTAMLSRFYLSQSHFKLAGEHFRSQRYNQAASHYAAAAQANPSAGGFPGYLAACYLRSGQTTAADREMERMLAADPGNPALRIRLALLKWTLGEPLQSLSLLREGVELHPTHAEMHYQLGVCLAADGDLETAEREFQKAVALDPVHAGAFERLAQGAAATDRSELAMRYLERAHRLDPTNARILMQVSLLAGTGAPSDEIRRASLPVAAIPLHSTIDNAAIDRLGEAMVAEPDFIQTFLSLPPSDTDREIFTTLAITLERSLQKHPEFADLHYHCGEVYRRLGRAKEAIEHAESAVDINPRYVNALILLAELYGQTDRWMDGVERLEQAIAAGGDFPDVHFLIGKLLQTHRQWQRARQAYQRALKLNRSFHAAAEALDSLRTQEAAACLPT